MKLVNWRGRLLGWASRDRSGREVGRKVRGHDLEEAVRVGEVLEAMLAEIAQAHPVRKVLGDERGDGVREQNLAAVPGRSRCGPPDGRPCPRSRLAADAARRCAAPSGPAAQPRRAKDGRDGPLRRDGRQQRLARAGKGHKERIPLRVDLLAVSFLNAVRSSSRCSARTSA